MALREDYLERKKEVVAYLDFLNRVEQLDVENPVTVEPIQQQILFANVYLLLYNLVESTITGCGLELPRTFTNFTVSQINQLTKKIREYWIKQISQYTKSANEERLKGLKRLVEKLIDNQALLEIQFDFGGAGNLDNIEIEKIFQRYGIDVKMSQELKNKVCRHCYDDMGTMQAVKYIRNALAHGEKSFTECGNFSMSDIRKNADVVFEYLEFVIGKTEQFIENKEYNLKITVKEARTLKQVVRRKVSKKSVQKSKKK